MIWLFALFMISKLCLLNLLFVSHNFLLRNLVFSFLFDYRIEYLFVATCIIYLNVGFLMSTFFYIWNLLFFNLINNHRLLVYFFGYLLIGIDLLINWLVFFIIIFIFSNNFTQMFNFCHFFSLGSLFYGIKFSLNLSLMFN